jgi:hypothetical protein
MWTALLLPVLVLAVADSQVLQVAPHCQKSCGSLENIPFPFGIGDGCFMPGFKIDCNGGTPTLADSANSDKLEVLTLTVMPRPEARLMMPIAYKCYDTTTGDTKDSSSASVYITPPYRISNNRSELVVLGCNTFVYTNSGPWNRNLYSFYSGCMSYCDDGGSAKDGACAGIGCCRVDLPPGLTDNKMTFFHETSDWSHAGMDFSPCDYAFIVEKNSYNFTVSDLQMNGGATSKPLVLDWALRGSDPTSKIDNMKCADVENKPGYACVSDKSECLNSENGPGYICNCTTGYWGNPYVKDGCQGN